MTVYKELKVRTYINALDFLSSLGGSLPTKAVLDAMEEASRSFVRMDDLQRAVGERIAEMTDNEGAVVVSGTAAGMMLCAAVLMTDGDAEKMMRLPDAQGMRNEILVLKAQQAYFDGEMCVTGARLVAADAGAGECGKLREAITERTCAIFYAEVHGRDTLTFEEALSVANDAGLPLVVNAAAQIPPKESLWKYTKAGAAAAIFAGGRALRGPSGSGLVVGKKWLTDAILTIAPPKHSVASVANIGREEIVGLYTALEEYLAGDDYAERIDRVNRIIREVRHRVERAGYFECRRVFPGPQGQNYPRMALDILGSYSAEALVEMLESGDPAILAARSDDSPNGITLNLLLLTDDEVEIVLRRVEECAEALTLMK